MERCGKVLGRELMGTYPVGAGFPKVIHAQGTGSGVAKFESGLVLHRKCSPAKQFCLAGLFRLHLPHNAVPY